MLAATVGTLLVALPGTSQAIHINWSVGASLEHSDNIGLTQTDQQSEDVFTPTLDFDTQKTGSTLALELRGHLEYLRYLQNTYADERRNELAGQLRWTVSPQRLDFLVKDYLSSQPISVFSGDAAGNRQQVNVFVAGPSFYARFNDTTRGQLDLRYTNSYAEKTQGFNGNRYNVATRLLHQLSPVSSVSLNAEATRVDYNTGNSIPDYDRYDLYLNYLHTLPKVDVALDAGYSWLDLDGKRVTSQLLRAKADWRFAPRHQVDASVAYQFGDAAQIVVDEAGDVSGPLIRDFTNADVLIGPSVFRERRVAFGYAFTGERFTFGVHPFVQRTDYLIDIGLDQHGRGAAVEATYLLRPRMKLILFAGRGQSEFDDLNRTDHDTAIYLSLVDELTRHWSWRVDLRHRNRDSTEAGRTYDENAATLSFSYRR